jgi:hypothetical protein
LAALLVLAAATEFLFVAVAAYFAAILYHGLILLDWPDPAKYIPESLLISTLDLLVSLGHRQYSRIQTQPRHVFLWNGASGVFLVFSFFLATIFLLKISEDYSRATVMVQAASVGLAVLCTRTIWFSLLQPAICLQLTVSDGSDYAYLVVKRRSHRLAASRLGGLAGVLPVRIPYSDILHCSAPEVLSRHLERVKLAILRRQRTAALVAEARLLPVRPRGVLGPMRTCYRSSLLAAGDVDRLYSEIVLLPI